MTTTALDQHTDQVYAQKSDVCLQYGQVYAIQDNKFGVTTMDESWWVTLAASCVLTPVVGDTVLFSVQKTHNAQEATDQTTLGYILSVLHRADDNADAELNLPTKANAKLNTFSIQADTLHTQGNNHVALWQEHTEISQTHNQFSQRINIQAQNRTTKIQQHDELKADSQRIIIARDWRVRAQDTDIRAQRQASMDGQQIRLG